MAKFKCNEPLLHGGRHRRAGAVIELTTEEAATFTTSLVTALDAPKTDASKLDSAKAEAQKIDTDKSTNASEKK